MACSQGSSERLANLLPALPVELKAIIAAAHVTTSFVVDERGSSVGKSGNSAGLGNKTDLALLRYIRSQSEIVLTSGRTARADQISMPKTADLAIFTSVGIETLNLAPSEDQALVLIGPEQASDYPAALEHLKLLGYLNIQVEFGESGLASVLSRIQLCVISSRMPAGVELFMHRHGIAKTAYFVLDDLVIAVGSGRGKG